MPGPPCGFLTSRAILAFVSTPRLPATRRPAHAAAGAASPVAASSTGAASGAGRAPEPRKGARTRARVVAAALKEASTRGLEAVSLAPLAAEAGLSKSGLFAHFGSKEALQLEVLDAAEAAFRAAVWEPAQATAAGVARLRAVFDAWVGWSGRAGLPGGCPFVGAAAELDDQPGPVRDHLVASQERWFRALAGLAREAVRGGEFRADLDARQFAADVLGAYLAYHWTARLLGHADAAGRARCAFDALVDAGRSTASRSSAATAFG